MIMIKDRRREKLNERCFRCRHIQSIMLGTCDAFPNQIPIEIWTGKNDHSQPFPGDNGIQFEPRVMRAETPSEVAERPAKAA
jgi:hypothetical protein